MKTHLQNPLALVATLACRRGVVTFSAAACAARIERGDSDTSASTIRTAGAVGLVIIVIVALITPVLLVATNTSTYYNTIQWPAWFPR